MVLSHQSGFPNWRENEDDQQLKIKFNPGTDYLYSGEGYQYLAMVLREIEQVNWQGLDSIFQQKIAEPLKMEHTFFIQTEYTRKNKAQPYDENANPVDWKNNYWHQKDDGRFVAPSSLHSNVIDFSKWMMAVMNKQVLTQNSYRQLFKIHSTPNEGQYYTLGFLTLDKPYNTVFLHGGDNDGFTGGYVMDIDKKWGFVLVTNSEKGQELTNELFDFFIEE